MTIPLVTAVTATLNATGKLVAYDAVPKNPPPIYVAVLDGTTQAIAHRLSPTAHWDQAAVRVLVVARTLAGAREARTTARAALQGVEVVEGSSPLIETIGAAIYPDGPKGDVVYLAPLNYITSLPLT